MASTGPWAPATTRGPSRDGALALLTLVSMLPFFASSLLLSTDLPQHLAAAELARRGSSALFTINLWPRPYLLATHLLLLLGQLLPLATAARVLYGLYAVALAWSFRALVDSAPQKDGRLALWAPLFVSSWPLAYGFLPYLLGIPALLWALALARRLRDDAPSTRWVGLAGALFWASYAHPLTGVIAGLLVLSQLYDQPKPVRRRTFLAALPAGGLALVALWVTPPEAALLGTDQGLSTWWRFGIKAKLSDYALTYLPGVADQLTALPGLLVVPWALWRGRRGAGDPLERAAWLIGGLYLLAPADLAVLGLRISLLGPRLVVLVWLLAVAAIRGPVPAPLRAVVGASTVAFSLLLTFTARSYSAEWTPALDRAWAQLPPGAQLRVRSAPPAAPIFHPGLVGPPEAQLAQLAYLHGAQAVEGTFSTRQAPVWQTQNPVWTVTWVQTASASIRLLGPSGF